MNPCPHTSSIRLYVNELGQLASEVFDDKLSAERINGMVTEQMDWYVEAIRKAKIVAGREMLPGCCTLVDWQKGNTSEQTAKIEGR
jgi:hypothetical protein